MILEGLAMRIVSPLLASLLLTGTVAGFGSAQAADYLESRGPAVVSANVPACNDPAVLGQVEDQFEYGAPRVLETKLSILEFSAMAEKAYFPAVKSGEPPISPVERRYCQAEALLSDQITRRIYYVVEYPMGFAAAGGYLGAFSPVKGWRAEGCVLGLDEWHVYGANCQSLRRFQPEGRTGYGYVTK